MKLLRAFQQGKLEQPQMTGLCTNKLTYTIMRSTVTAMVALATDYGIIRSWFIQCKLPAIIYT